MRHSRFLSVRRAGSISGAALVMLAGRAMGQSATFVTIPDLPGGSVMSEAFGISPNGGVVVGISADESGTVPIRWTASGGTELVPGLMNSAYSEARGVSNGGVVVGMSMFDTGGTEAFRWEAGPGTVGLGQFGGEVEMSEAVGVSADGVVVVGWGGTPDGPRAFRSTGGGLLGLGDIPGGTEDSNAEAISADGRVIVGLGSGPAGAEAFRWTGVGGMVGLGDLPGGRFSSSARGVNANGSVVVGYGYGESDVMEAFRWSMATGMIGLGDLPGGGTRSLAQAVSADGSVVVGVSESAAGIEAFLWTGVDGMRALKDVLQSEHGIDLAGWRLISVRAISSDGRTIVGYGVNPQEELTGYVATLPAPPALFQPLGDLEGGAFGSLAQGVSGNGQAVTGFGSTEWIRPQAFRWTVATGFESIGDLLGGGPDLSIGNAISTDGLSVAGTSESFLGTEAFRWRVGGEMIPLGDLPGGDYASDATAISSDGSVIVGISNSENGVEAFRWTEEEGIVGLGDLPTGNFFSNAHGVSGDGSVVVGTGWVYTLNGGPMAFRWTEENGMSPLGDLAGGGLVSHAYDVSDDGAFAAGDGSVEGGRVAVRFGGGGVLGLGDLPGGDLNSTAYGISGDGSVVAGRATSERGAEAFIWTEAEGLRSVERLLSAGYGIDMTGWRLENCRDVSADGTTLVGYGQNPQGRTEAFRVVLGRPCDAPTVAVAPAPQTVCLGGDAAFSVAAAGDGFFTYRWRRNGAPLSDGAGNGGAEISGSETATLSISGAGDAEQGDYDCVVTTGCGETVSPPAVLFLCRADWNCLDGLDSQDYFDFLEALFGGDADFNGVDGTDSQDYFDFLEAFFVGCG